MFYIYFLCYLFSSNTSESDMHTNTFIKSYINDDCNAKYSSTLFTSINNATEYKELIKDLYPCSWLSSINSFFYKFDNNKHLRKFIEKYRKFICFLIPHEKFDFVYPIDYLSEQYKNRFIDNYIELELRKISLTKMLSFLRFSESINLDDIRYKNILKLYIDQIINTVEIYSKFFYELRIIYFYLINEDQLNTVDS